MPEWEMEQTVAAIVAFTVGEVEHRLCWKLSADDRGEQLQYDFYANSMALVRSFTAFGHPQECHLAGSYESLPV